MNDAAPYERFGVVEEGVARPGEAMLPIAPFQFVNAVAARKMALVAAGSIDAEERHLRDKARAMTRARNAPLGS